MTGRDYLRWSGWAVLYAYAYVILEWLFFVTKPSLLSAWSLPARVEALLVGAIPFALAAIAVQALFSLIAYLTTRSTRLSSRAGLLLRITPALIAVAILLMLVDNFTYTVFRWGIVDTSLLTAPLYWVGAALAFVLLLRRQAVPPAAAPWAAAALLTASAVMLLWSLSSSKAFHDTEYRSAWDGPQLPNIVVFASDGVPADHLSAYGYARRTSPNLDAYMDQALVADNAYTNAVWTTGSLSSLMTGKYPATTKLLLPPHTLKGKDAYQSLPRILRKLGYTTMQETLRYYADGPDLNWQQSFDVANGRELHWLPANPLSVALQGPLELSHQFYERLSDRVQQLARTKQMINSYAAVTGEPDITKVWGISDQKRMERVTDFIRNTRGPFFVHVHLMETHCCNIHVRKGDRHFSAAKGLGKAQLKTALFDDTVLRADRYFGQLMQALQDQHLLDNTVVVFTSDHDKGWDFRSPVPLVFLFPGGANKGHIAATTQLLDVAPTLLDYLNVDVPAWMEGKSLLADRLRPERPVFTIFHLQRRRIHTGKARDLEVAVDLGPPRYGLETLGMVVCHRWYVMDLVTRHVNSGSIGDFTNPLRATPGAPLLPGACGDIDPPDDDEAVRMMSEHLEQRGFGL